MPLIEKREETAKAASGKSISKPETRGRKSDE
jgi:hypothetical protein